MTKGQMEFAAFVVWLVGSGSGIYLGFIYLNPIFVWLVGVTCCPAALLLTLQKINPEGYIDDDDQEARPSKNNDDEDDMYMKPPAAVGYRQWDDRDDD
jgi:hypothetical protein